MSSRRARRGLDNLKMRQAEYQRGLKTMSFAGQRSVKEPGSQNPHKSFPSTRKR